MLFRHVRRLDGWSVGVGRANPLGVRESLMPGTPPPEIHCAELYFWHESMSIDDMSDCLGIKPNRWHCGELFPDGEPPNNLILHFDGPSAITELVQTLRLNADGFRSLTARGAKAYVMCYYRGIHDAGLPVITPSEGQLLANLSIDLVFRQTCLEEH